jgi:hypothetical protein
MLLIHLQNNLLRHEEEASDVGIHNKVSREKIQRCQGETHVALVEGPSKDNPLVWEARLEGMAPDIDGKLYLTDIVLRNGQTAAVGDVTRVEIEKTDAYDLIGRVVEILPRAKALAAVATGSATGERLTRISTGAPLRVLG